MSEWKKVRIGDIFSIEKGSLQSSKCTPGEYDFITAATDWKTHNSFDHECEAIVYAVAASGSLGRAHYVNGKFIASDLCFILTEKDKKQYPINFFFYYIVFEMIRDEIVSKTKTGTSKESINRGNFSNYEIPYFPIEFQLANYQKFVNAKNIIKNLLEESEKQKNYIKQLRQNILQEAIEAKLTSDWRKQNPVQKGNPDYDAEALFEQIQKEKYHTDSVLLTQNQDKKKKGKSLDFPYPCDNEEKPFAIPDGWKWVRLGEIIDSIVYGTSEKCSYDDRQNSAILRIPNLSSGIIDATDLKYTNLSKTEKNELSLRENDVLVIRSNGSPEIVGKMVNVPKDYENYCYAGYLIRLRFTIPEIGLFIAKISSTNNLRKQIEEPLRTTVGINNINSDEIKALRFPLPPLEEQKEIVTKIEKHLQSVSDLENQITKREQLTKQLMQSILKDAFEEN